jgi:hypothetical protein
MIIRILSAIIITHIVLVPILPQENAINPTSNSGFYTITYKNTDVNLELKANGYIIKDSSSNDDSSGQEDINHWIIPKNNKLSIRISERKPNQSKSTFPISKSVQIKLIIAQAGQFPDEGKSILNFEWPKSNEKNQVPNGEWIDVTFDPPFVPPSQLWNQAEKIAWTKDLEKEAIGMMETLVKALNARNVKQVSSLLTFRQIETTETRYQNYDPAEEEKSLASMMKQIGSSWKLKKKDIKVNLLCDDKIANLTNQKNEALIQGKNGAEIPIYLGLVKGKLTFVR